MNEEEFKAMRARTDIPHSDEITKDQHDNSGYSDMDNQVPIYGFCLAIVITVILVLGITILAVIYL